MTFHYQMTKELHAMKEIYQCVNCGLIMFPGLNGWYAYDGKLPPSVKRKVHSKTCMPCKVYTAKSKGFETYEEYVNHVNDMVQDKRLRSVIRR